VSRNAFLTSNRRATGVSFGVVQEDLRSLDSGSRYEMREKIGAGGSGSVYQAWDSQLHRFVAFKRLHIDSETVDVESEGVWREAMTLASVQHPNILTIYDSGIDQIGPYVVTEFIEGKTIHTIVEEAGPYDVKPFAEAVVQIMEGLIAAHARELIHRDLKPQNIMVRKLASGADQYKILDFGLAKFISKPSVQTMDGDRGIRGTLLYLAPEQFTKKPIDARTDLYAIGCVFYFMLAGDHPFKGETVAEVLTNHLQHNVVDLHQVRPDVDRVLCDWVMKLIHPAVADRPVSASAALDAFRSIPFTATGRRQVIRVPSRIADARTGKVSSSTGVIKVAEKIDKDAEEKTAGKPLKQKKPWRLVSTISLVVLIAVTAIVGLVRRRTAARPTATQTKKTKVVARKKEPAKTKAVKEEPRAAETEPTKIAKVEEKKTETKVDKPTDRTVPADLRSLIGEEVSVSGEIVDLRRSKRTSSVYITIKDQSGEEVTLAVFVNDAERQWVDDNLKESKGQTAAAHGQLRTYKDTLQIRLNDIKGVEFNL